MKTVKHINLKLAALLTGVFLFIFPLFAEVKEGSPSFTEIEKEVQELMEEGNIPGLSLVMVRGPDEIFIKGFGYADLGKKIPVTSETLFELASCSKAFTALALLRLEEEGLIDLDAPVSDYLPWFYLKYKKQKPPITIRQCLHHTSGIPTKTIADIPKGDHAEALQQTVENLVGSELTDIPGKQFEYATINYDILGAIIEKLSGKSFEEYMANYIFQPLGLSQTIVGVGKVPPPNKAVGYKIGFFAPRAYDPPVFRGNNPAGYVISNARDMARWLRIQMGLVETDFTPLIQRSHVPDITVPPPADLASYAMGWSVDQFRGGTVNHGGLNPNFTAYIAFRPAGKIGVVLLANSNSTYTHSIGSIVLKRLAGEDTDHMHMPEDNIDTFCSIVSIVVVVYILVMITLIILRISGIVRRKIEFESITWKKFRRLVVSLLMYLPFFFGIYLIPYVLAGMSWETAMVWAPASFYALALLLITAMVTSYIYFSFSLLFVTKNRYRNEIPLMVIISILSGLAGTGMLFLITTSFFSPASLGYLMYYFALAYLGHIGGRKIVQSKMITISNNIALDLRIDLIHKLFAARYQRIEKIHDGRIFTTLNDDTGTLSGSANVMIDFITNFVTAVTTFVYMTTISVISTLIVIGVLILLAVYYTVVSRRSRVYMEAARDTSNVYMSLLNGLIKGFKELAIHQAKKNEFKEDLIDSAKENCSKSVTAAMKFLNANIFGESVMLVILGIISIVLPRYIVNTSIISLVMFVMVIVYLLGPIRNVLGAIQPITRLQVSWNRVRDFIKDMDVGKDQKSMTEFVRDIDLPKATQSNASRVFKPKHKEIENILVEGLMFAYENENGRKGFSVGPIDFEVNKGESLFVIGGNGSGKTTLVKLITGLYLCEGGCMKINGEEVDGNQIGEYFSTIFSNYHLFKKLYNIDLNKKDSIIQHYLKLLNLQDKVELKDGEYSTLDLSGGQRKRLALFQCYLENRPIFLFDELAADQDPDFRRLFYRELLGKMKEKGKIVIAVTHDDHYFDAADKIIKLDMGKVDHFSSSEAFIKREHKILGQRP